MPLCAATRSTSFARTAAFVDSHSGTRLFCCCTWSVCVPNDYAAWLALTLSCWLLCGLLLNVKPPPPARVCPPRARMAPSPATGLVGLEENVYVADFFDRLGFFPIANQG